MSLQEIFDQERPIARPATVRRMRSAYTVSGAAGSQIFNTASDYTVAINANNDLIQNLIENIEVANNLLSALVVWGVQQTGVVEVAVSNVDEGEYDPGFVAQILQADAAEPEAKFTNIVDMLEWLNRD